MKKGNKATKKPVNRKRRSRRLVIGSAIGAVVLGVVVGGVYAYIRPNAPTLPGQNGNPFTSLFSAPQVENILLIGNNARNPAGPLDIGTGGGGQADIMMIAHVDPATHHVELISCPRDAMVAMPNFSDPIPKLKSFFFMGAQETPNQAAQLTVQAVEKFTGLTINHYVVTDFQGFVDAINAVGGVRIYVPGRIYDPYHSGANLYPGWQTLDGAQALAYVRVRQNLASNYSVNDFERDDVQARVLEALQKKLLDKSNDLSHIGALVSTWNKDVVTDMSYQQLLSLAEEIHGYSISHIDLGDVGDSMNVLSAPAPGMNAENYITGAFYDIIDSAHITAELKPYGSTGGSTGFVLPPPSQIPVEVYGSSITVDILKKHGYNVTYMGPGGTTPDQIYYPAGDLLWGLRVGRSLATGDSVVEQGTNTNAVVVYGA
jgi:LCP family protein required for cell wall assembly